MINEIKIDLELPEESQLESAYNQSTSCHSDPYSKLIETFSDLNERSEKYCVRIQVSKEPLSINSELDRRLDSFMESLSKREMEVYHLAMKGLSNRLIALNLFISIETVKSHRKRIVSKAGVRRVADIKDLILQANKLLIDK